MMATQTIVRSSMMTGEKTRPSSDAPLSARRTPQSPVFIPPNEFRMKLLKRILSVDGTIDNKALQKLQKTSSERTLQANILFENGDVGTLISFDRTHEETLKQDHYKTADASLPLVDQRKVKQSDRLRDGVPRERPLKLPPIMLPPIYTLTSRTPDCSGLLGASVRAAAAHAMRTGKIWRTAATFAPLRRTSRHRKKTRAFC
ncbi:uncharacterized protein LOC127857575 isoform X5 [Dreissena polymorpha]|uniref:uncharacterized protein LOC127857575 isoform X4 n=1 Tax=Dreissena polymorpha TaxID=45954 RepID=UPI0022646FA7|nr:uncharacterized protein LOC127857575 isoform X4 [Dreissena polymorpha]XP_052250006.1 uncharacterized protein LOC127857575 isoform X5 [Dreissena polymorpha]